jgi:hypothetical protein
VSRMTVIGALLVGTLTGGCGDYGADKRVAGIVGRDEAPFGPKIIYEPLRRPVPEIPFPNDLMLRPSDQTANGVAWNISEDAPTALERRIRREMGKLDGFGVYSPIFVPFDGPLALETVTDESVVLVNIEPDHPRRGERVLLDLSKGFFPETMPQRSYWPFDPQEALADLYLGAGNDADSDGDGDTERVTHWEVETNTLILKPVKPLAPACRHAVLIGRAVQGDAVDEEGAPITAPVRSPWPYKAHAAQAEFVRQALDLVDWSPDELAFGWTYTTTDAAKPMLNLREGIHGRGPLAALGQLAPPHVGVVRDTDVLHDSTVSGVEPKSALRDHPFILQGAFLGELFEIVGGIQPGLSIDFQDVDYFVFGSFATPDIRTGEDRMIGVNFHTGEGEAAVNDVPYLLSVPKTVVGRHEPPFPVVLYFHGTATSRMEAVAIANQMARQGLAMLSFDQVGHGPIIPDIPLLVSSQGLDISIIEIFGPILAELLVPHRADEFYGLEWEEWLEKMSEIGLWNELALHGRTEDQNGDGALESSEGFFWGNPFKMCGSVWQDLSDFFYAVAVLRNFDPAAVPPKMDDPANATVEALQPHFLAGDFNADGVLDVGGPDVQLSVAGTSLGGLHTILAAALEPEVTVATPIVGGGGLADLMLRTDFRMIVKRIFLEIFGPLVVGCPDGEGGVWLSFNDDSRGCRPEEAAAESFAHLVDVPPGSLVRLVNIDNEESSALFVGAELGFSIAVPTDVADHLEFAVLRPGAAGLDGWERVEVYSPYEGVAMKRNSPRFRRFMGIANNILDRCDPISVAHHLFQDPLPGHPPVDILYELALGDETVPISAGVQVALASGIFGEEPEAWRPVMDEFIARGVMTGGDYDVDDLLGDNPPESPPMGPLQTVPSSEGGVSGIRFADVDGEHEWIINVQPDAVLDHATYSQHQVVLYHWSHGAAVVDDLCIQETTCELLDDPEARLP